MLCTCIGIGSCSVACINVYSNLQWNLDLFSLGVLKKNNGYRKMKVQGAIKNEFKWSYYVFTKKENMYQWYYFLCEVQFALLLLNKLLIPICLVAPFLFNLNNLSILVMSTWSFSVVMWAYVNKYKFRVLDTVFSYEPGLKYYCSIF